MVLECGFSVSGGSLLCFLLVLFVYLIQKYLVLLKANWVFLSFPFSACIFRLFECCVRFGRNDLKHINMYVILNPPLSSSTASLSSSSSFPPPPPLPGPCPAPPPSTKKKFRMIKTGTIRLLLCGESSRQEGVPSSGVCDWMKNHIQEILETQWTSICETSHE